MAGAAWPASGLGVKGLRGGGRVRYGGRRGFVATRVTKHANPQLLRHGVRGVAGEPMEIVVHLPRAPALAAVGFECDSALPGASLLACLPLLARAASEQPSARLMLFGHADEAGSEAYNKKLADRRAQVMLALLTQDLAGLDSVARDDDWKLVQYQAIMKMLGISPMSVDGKPGASTKRGLKTFQLAYNAGDYHPEGGRPRAHDKLKVDGAIGPRSESALRDAYLAMVSVKVDAARFMGPKTAGCGEFNRAGGAERDRRVVLAVYGADFPTESRIPCKAGDAASCKFNKKATHPWKCNFYRRTLEAEQLLEAPPLPGRVKILAQTVDELGYRLGHQSLVFIDETGLESHVSSDDKGVFDGYVQVRGSGLSVRSPDGITRRVRDGAFSQPALIDVVIRSDQRTATQDEELALASVYDRTPVDQRRGRILPDVQTFGEPWSTISNRLGEEE